jgi:hypothetical protein
MTKTPDPSDAPDLATMLARAAELYQSLHAILGDTLEVETQRDLLTQGTCSVAIEHGVSVCVLVEMENVVSAIVLQRAQFESVVRALWLHDVASDDWLERYFAAVKANPLKDPNFSPKIPEMLSALADSRHTPAVRMLNTLKETAWGPFNSYVHSGIHPIIQHHAGFPPEYAIQVLRNSNGLSGMAATLMALQTGDADIVMAVRNAQLAHLDCLPPIPR